MKLGELIRLMKHSGLNRNEICAIVKYRFGIEAADIPLRSDDAVDETGALSDAVLVSNGEPVEYITGFVKFYGADIKVTSDTLIPRVETELLCDEVYKAAKSIGAIRLADVCTGSGCIAVSLAKKLRIKTDAFDISKSAVEVARENAARNGASELVDFYVADVLYDDFFLPAEYDIVVSNPPYISDADMKALPESVKREPEIALAGGIDGLDFYRALTGTCRKYIRRGGALFFEIGDGEGDGVLKIALENGLSAVVKRDFAGRERIVRIDI